MSFGWREQRLTALVALRGMRSRQYIAGTLWPDSDESHARTSLRTAVMHVRERAPGLLAVTRQALGLGERVRLDVQEFLDDLRDAGDDDDARGLATLLSGEHELLPGWYEEWVIIEREQLQLTKLRALQRVAHRALQAGDPETAVRSAWEAVRIEPLYEPAHAVLIRAHLADQDPAAAVRQYARLERALARELGIRPSEQIDELVRPVLGAVAAPRPRARLSGSNGGAGHH